MIAITAGDYYIAQSIARQLLQDKDLHGQVQVRVLARNPARCEDLRRLGAQVIQVDYQQEERLQEALQNVQWVVLVPEPDNARVQGTENVICAINKANVRNVVVISSNAAEAQGRRLQQYKQIEQRVQRELQDRNWVVLRNDLIQQYFLYLSNWVEEKRQLPLPICERSKFVPVDINDVSRAVQQIMTHGQRRIQNLDEGLNRQILNLTGPEAVDGPRIVNELKNATGNQEVRFQQVDREQFRNYLNQLREDDNYEQGVRRNEPRTQARIQAQERADQKPPAAPNSVEVDELLDFFEWVGLGKDENVSRDLQKIIGQDGSGIKQFFHNHQDNFRPSIV